MDNLDELVNVLENSENAKALKETAKEVGRLAFNSGNPCNRKGLVEADGLIGGLIRVMGKDGEGFREAREEAVGAIRSIARYGSDEVKKGLFEYDGLVDCLLGRMREGGEVERERAVWAILLIAGGDNEVKKGLFAHEGLIDGLVGIAGKTGNGYVDARECAVWAMNNIADGDDEVKAGLFHFPGLMPRIEEILGDASLNWYANLTRTGATTLTTTLLTWQHGSFRATFETYTLLLKLCNMKVARAHPTSDSLSTLFRDSKDVASHILSFLESKRSDLDHAKDRARNHGEIIWK